MCKSKKKKQRELKHVRGMGSQHAISIAATHKYMCNIIYVGENDWSHAFPVFRWERFTSNELKKVIATFEKHTPGVFHPVCLWYTILVQSPVIGC